MTTMRARRTRRGDPEPENRPADRGRSSGSGRGRRVENLGKPPRRVRGGPQPRWPREGPAVRPPAHGCRGRAGRRGAFGRTVGPPGRGPDRNRTTAGYSAADGRRGGSMVEPGSGCRVDRVAPRAVGRRGGTVDQGSVGNRWSSRVRERSVDGCSGSGSEPDPSGLGSGSGSSDGTVRQVDVRRRGGSEELTGSPGGYSGPLSRFRTASAGPWSGPSCGITGRRTPTRPRPPATPSPSPRRP